MIRLANLNDLETMTNLAVSVYGDFLIKHDIQVDIDSIRQVAKAIIEAQTAIVLERDNVVLGMAAWICSPHPANAKIKIFQEVLWTCVSPIKTDALRLLRAFEAEALNSGANIVVIANLDLENEPKLRNIYERLGYGYLETHYLKSIRR